MAIVQVEMRSLTFYHSLHRVGRSFKSRALVVRSWYSMPFFGVGPLPRRCVLTVCSLRLHKTLIPLSPSCKVNVQVARCAQATAAAVLSPSTSDVYTAHPPSCRAISLVEMRCWRSRCLKTFFRSWTVLPLCSRRPHRTFIPLLPSCNDQSSRDALVVRSWFLMPFFGVRPPPLLCSRRPHRTFVPRSRHRTSRDALDALMVLDALFGVGPPPSLCSRALAVHIRRLFRSRHRARRSYKSRRALIALMVLDALLWRRNAATAVISPSTQDVYNTALAIVQGAQSSRDALFALTVLGALL